MKRPDTEIPEDYVGPCYIMSLCVDDGTAEGHHHKKLVFYRKTATTDMLHTFERLVSLPGFQTVRVDYYADAELIDISAQD